MSTANLQLARLAVAGLSARDRLEFMRELSIQKPGVRAARILRRAEVATRFGVTVRAIDLWGKNGLLKRRVLAGHRRASGYLESDIEELMQGRRSAGGEVV